VGAVVLPASPLLDGLNDSKKLSAPERQRIAAEINRVASVSVVVYVEPQVIDEKGMSASLRLAFGKAIREVEQSGAAIDAILIDGNPLHVDDREINVVKGDASCASIAAASIVAKVHRDAFMTEIAHSYPVYGFDRNKGYASEEHIDAIRAFGLCPIHRRSFCHGFLQESLF
ncbi:MAG: ribonuclease HII, partial [Eggerthellaceae bacterium]|nr:ribonuclease HII [Eggerthellaceae bacterium]